MCVQAAWLADVAVGEGDAPDTLLIRDGRGTRTVQVGNILCRTRDDVVVLRGATADQ